MKWLVRIQHLESPSLNQSGDAELIQEHLIIPSLYFNPNGHAFSKDLSVTGPSTSAIFFKTLSNAFRVISLPPCGFSVNVAIVALSSSEIH